MADQTCFRCWMPINCCRQVASFALCSSGFCVLCRFRGSGRKCVPAVDGSTGPICKAPKLGLCCDESQHHANQDCLIPPKGTNCTAESPFGPGPVKAFCCDAMDLPGCEAFGDPTQCPVSYAEDCTTDLILLMSACQCTCPSLVLTPKPVRVMGFQ